MKARGERVKQRRAVAEISRVEGEAVSRTASESRAYWLRALQGQRYWNGTVLGLSKALERQGS